MVVNFTKFCYIQDMFLSHAHACIVHTLIVHTLNVHTLIVHTLNPPSGEGAECRKRYYDFSDFQDMSSRFNNVLLIVSDIYVLQQRKRLQSHLTHHTYTK